MAERIEQPYDCLEALDGDDDGQLSVSDAIALLRWNFSRGPPLPSPFRGCGSTPGDGPFNCNDSSPDCTELGLLDIR